MTYSEEQAELLRELEAVKDDLAAEKEKVDRVRDQLINLTEWRVNVIAALQQTGPWREALEENIGALKDVREQAEEAIDLLDEIRRELGVSTPGRDYLLEVLRQSIREPIVPEKFLVTIELRCPACHREAKIEEGITRHEVLKWTCQKCGLEQGIAQVIPEAGQLRPQTELERWLRISILDLAEQIDHRQMDEAADVTRSLRAMVDEPAPGRERDRPLYVIPWEWIADELDAMHEKAERRSRKKAILDMNRVLATLRYRVR